MMDLAVATLSKIDVKYLEGKSRVVRDRVETIVMGVGVRCHGS